MERLLDEEKYILSGVIRGTRQEERAEKVLTYIEEQLTALEGANTQDKIQLQDMLFELYGKIVNESYEDLNELFKNEEDFKTMFDEGQATD